MQGGEGGRTSHLPPQSGEALSFPYFKIIYPGFSYCKFFSLDLGKYSSVGLLFMPNVIKLSISPDHLNDP